MDEFSAMSAAEVSRRRFLQLATALGLSLGLPGGVYAMNPILRRKIPKSDEELPIVGLGTWRAFDVAGGSDARDPHREVLRLLFEASGGVIDASPMYGKAEEVVGDLLSETDRRGDTFLATKVWTEGRDRGIAQMDESLRRFRTDRIDLMQIHNLVDWQTQLETLRLWKAAGIFRYIGITHYASGAIDNLVAVMEREDIDFVQMAYSIGERAVEDRLLPVAAERGIAVIVNRPFDGGGIFDSVAGENLPEWVTEFDCQSWSQFFLKYVLSHPAVTCAIPATAKPAHMLDNLQAGQGRLPDKAMRRKMVEFWEDV